MPFARWRLGLAALVAGGICMGCRDSGPAQSPEGPERIVAEQFPDQAAMLLPPWSTPEPFIREQDRIGLVRARTPGPAGFLGVSFPEDGALPVRLSSGDDFSIEIHEQDASGPVRVLAGEATLAYSRPGRTSYWRAAGDGLEEWILVERGHDGLIAEWEVRGGKLRPRSDGVVEVRDARGRVRMEVSAPAAYGAGGVRVPLQLTARGPRLQLFVSGAGEGPLLIDPYWTPVAQDLTTARFAHTATRISASGKVLIAGGADASSSPLSSVELYDPLNASPWSAGASMATARARQAAVELTTGRILVVGGVTTGGGLTTTAERYDPVANTWSAAGALTNARANHTATLLADGRVLVAGGLNFSSLPLASAELYSPGTNVWSAALPMNLARSQHTATLLLNGKVLVAGGNNGTGAVASAELYDPSIGTWSSVASMATARQQHTAVLLPSGKVLVVGGRNDGQGVLSSAEVYDPSQDLWSSAPPLIAGRFDHALTLLSSGRVVVTGGEGQGGSHLTRAEILDPAASPPPATWSPAGCMADARSLHSATLLSSGLVLVAGGRGATILASAELHDPAGALPNGAACTSGCECASQLCVDGFCCDAACGGACDACDLTGTEGTCSLQPDGASGDPSCSPYLCTGASASCGTSCSGDGDCAPGHFCDGSACLPKRSNGESCTSANQCTSNFCVDGVCCDTACGDACDACDLSGSVGTCTPAPAGDPGAPVCAPYVCDGSAASCPTSCASDSGCVSTHYCLAGACVPKKNDGETCGAARECASGFCVDGVCCNSACGGACEACNLTGTEGACTVLTAGNAGAPTCAPYLCDGASGSCPTSCTADAQCTSDHFCSNNLCVPKRPNGDTCSASNQCTSGFCADGVCCDTACGGACDACNLSSSVGTCAPMPPGAPGAPSCSPYVCDGASAACPSGCGNDANCAAGFYCSAGACVPKLPNGTSCSASNQCASAFCADGVCCDTACGGACDACNLSGTEGTCTPLSAGSPGAPPCAPYLCNGTSGSCPTSCTADTHCAAGAFCSSNVCVPKRPNGDGCSAANQCASGFCVDGVCCDGGCAGACEACNLAGSVGACTPAAAGSPGSPSCAPYLCDGSSGTCPSSCADDGDCASTHRCSAGTCVPKAPNGEPCAEASECASQRCVDGVCCGSACTGACEACDVPGSEGTCTPLPSGEPGNPSCAPYVCTGSSGGCPTRCTADAHCEAGRFCDDGACVTGKPNGERCERSSQCQSQQCVDGVCCDSACGGACDACNLSGSEGTCRTRPAGSACGAYVCSGEGPECLISCEGPQDCAEGYACQAGQCVEEPSRTAGYIGWSCGASGGGPLPLLWVLGSVLLAGLRRRGRSAGGGLAAVALLLGFSARAEEPPAAPVEVESTRATTRSQRELHLSALAMAETVSRQIGGEVGVSYSVLRRLDLGVGATLGDHPGGRVMGMLHPARDGGFALAPFLQLRGIVHPVSGGLGLGAGAWVGASYELGPGRVQGGVLGELYRGPPGYYPFAIAAALGYELDPFETRTEIHERVKVEEKVVVKEKIVEKEVAIAPTTAALRGQLTDLDDRPLSGELVFTQAPGEWAGRRVPANPAFELVLPPGDYEIQATAPGHLVRGRTFHINAGETLLADLQLRPVPQVTSAALTPERIEIKQSIQFAFNEARILPESFGLLDEVVDIVIRHPELKLRIEGHTDEIGSAEYNQKLSESRAAAVRNYLVEKGVSASRLSHLGHGASHPVASNATEEGRAQNRRVQFEIAH